MRDLDLDFHLFFDGDAGGHRVRLDVGERSAEAFLDLSDPQLARAVAEIEANRCSKELLREVGAQLWSALMAGEVGPLYEAVRKEGGEEACFCFRLRLDEAPGAEMLETLPWEALYEENPRGGAKFLSTHPAFCVVRTPFPRETEASVPAPLEGPLRVLVVVPEGASLGNSERELRNVEAVLSNLETAGTPVVLEKLVGVVTPDRLRSALRGKGWDVFHFIGHGRVVPAEPAREGEALSRPKPPRTEVRINAEEGGEHWMSGGDLADLCQGTGLRLAVFNCCLGGVAVAGRRLSGLGPALLNAGVAAVVAMRYEIGDLQANRFALNLYGELFKPDGERGRIDRAVESARESLFLNQGEDVGRPFITPVLFLSRSPKLFNLGAPAVSAGAPGETPAPSPVPAPPRLVLPDSLLEAFQGGRVVPVIGPGVLAAGAVRAASSAADVGDVAHALALQFGYPRMDEFAVRERMGKWMDSLLLQWVCQRFADQRRSLAQAVERLYDEASPPAPLLTIASWDLPGVFYLHFDALLEKAFQMRKRMVQVLDGVKGPVSQGDHPLLVHVKGSAPNWASQVLTEEEHGRLWDDLAAMDPDVLNLVRGYSGPNSRSLLLLGVHPRDPLVKRLIAKLMENWSGARREGAVFFVREPGQEDDPYWDQLRVRWIEADPGEVVESLTAVSEGGAR